MPIAAAVVGSAVIGAVSSKRAADQQAKGVQQSIDSTNALAKQASDRAISLYGSAQKSAHGAQQGVLDYYKQTNGQGLKALQQGNVLGQRALGQGYQQANNAILGLPVDMSFANNPQAVTADYSAINSAQLPAAQTSIINPAENQPSPQDIFNQASQQSQMQWLGRRY